MQLFTSKILLFGEYTIMHHPHALAFPLNYFSGKLDFADSNTNEFAFLIAKIKSDPEVLSLNFNVQKFEEDINKGLYFSSNIPQKSGLGSSGALTAALYQAYHLKKRENLILLKNDLARLESYIHGKSSGIDPLVSYTRSPILIKKENIDFIPMSSLNLSELQIFLVDSKIERNTKIFVERYQQLLQTNDFNQKIDQIYIPVLESCIYYFLQNIENKLLESFRELSRLQFDFFKMMIPDKIYEFWETGLKKDNYFMKLCGAGGGGFFLGCCLKKDVSGLPFDYLLVNKPY